MKIFSWISAAAFCAAIAFGAGAAQAQSVEAFYRGKDIRLLIGADVGGTYGLYAQLAARYLRQYIPGQPNIIMQNMPGAGGNVALNWSYSVAPKDGTLIHLVHAEVLFETLLTKGVRFNAKDYQYIGRLADADSVILGTRQSGARNFEDAKKREVTAGATGVTNIYALAPLMLNRLAGTRFRIIGGYKGTSDIFIAMERGEVDSAGVTYANVSSLHADKLKNGDFIPLFTISAKRLADYPEVPSILEFGSGAEKTLLDIYASSAVIGRALAFPPGVPQDRVEALRTAFTKMLADPAFLAEAERNRILLAPMAPGEISAYIDSVMNLPPAQIEAAQKLHEELINSSK